MHRIISLLLLLAATPAAAEVRRIPSPAAPESLAPSVTVDARGGLLLSWLQRDGLLHVLRFSRLTEHGFDEPTTVASGSDWFVNWADFPTLSALPSGDLIAHWLQKSGPGRFAYDIRVSRSRDAGRTWTAPVTPHRDGTETEHGFVSHFAWSPDLAGLVWLDGRETTAGTSHEHHGQGGAMTLRTAALNADAAIEREALLDTQVCDCCQTGAAIGNSGPLVVYRGRDAGEVRDIMIVRWLGDSWSQPGPVHRDGWVMPACPVNGPQVVARGSEVTVAWFTMANSRPRVQIARSTDGGASFGEPRIVAGDGVLGRVGLAQAPDGRIWLAWMDEHGGRARLLLATFDATLEEISRLAVAELPRGRISGFPRLAYSTRDGLLLAWTEAQEGRPQVATAHFRDLR